jgi:hypothetical protein
MNSDLVIYLAMIAAAVIGYALGWSNGYQLGKALGFRRGKSVNQAIRNYHNSNINSSLSYEQWIKEAKQNAR